jgi:isopropylmalate/homocitrate/citramalate synthase
MGDLPKSVKIVEVGPRDGLQNERQPVPTAAKIEFIDRLSATGLSVIEATSFVSPRKIPQLADAAEVFAGIEKRRGVKYPVLVPNIQGLERAMSVGVTDIAVFAAASDEFSLRNINASVEESLERFAPVAERALQAGLRIRGYISCVLGCPYQETVPLQRVVDVSRLLSQLGCYEVSLGDTIGVGTPIQARVMVEAVSNSIGIDRVAVHFHDTRGQALANILSCLEAGVSVVDAAVAGLGGCPYARGATGNVATEDLVYMLHGMDIDTGIDLVDLVEAGRFISQVLDRPPASRLGLIADKAHEQAENS